MEDLTVEEFKRRIDFLRLGIENELLRIKIGELIDDVIDAHGDIHPDDETELRVSYKGFADE